MGGCTINTFSSSTPLKQLGSLIAATPTQLTHPQYMLRAHTGLRPCRAILPWAEVVKDESMMGCEGQRGLASEVAEAICCLSACDQLESEAFKGSTALALSATPPQEATPLLLLQGEEKHTHKGNKTSLGLTLRASAPHTQK